MYLNMLTFKNCRRNSKCIKTIYAKVVSHYHRPENSYSFKYFPHSLCSNISVWGIHHSLPHLISHCLSRVTFFTPIFRVQNVSQLTYTALGLLRNLQPPISAVLLSFIRRTQTLKFLFLFFFLNKSLVLLYFYGIHHLTDFFFQELFTILSLMTSLQICTHTFHTFKQLKFRFIPDDLQLFTVYN